MKASKCEIVRIVLYTEIELRFGLRLMLQHLPHKFINKANNHFPGNTTMLLSVWSTLPSTKKLLELRIVINCRLCKYSVAKPLFSNDMRPENFSLCLNNSTHTDLFRRLKWATYSDSEQCYINKNQACRRFPVFVI